VTKGVFINNVLKHAKNLISVTDILNWRPFFTAILDFEVTTISNLFFYSVIWFLTPENMGLDIKIGSLAYLLFVLRTIYRNRLMDATAAILDLGVTLISKIIFYTFVRLYSHKNIGLDTKIESLTCLFLCHKQIASIK